MDVDIRPKVRHAAQVGLVASGSASLERAARALLRAFVVGPFARTIAGGQPWRVVAAMCIAIIDA